MPIWDLLISIYDADIEHRFLPICHTTAPADLMITISVSGEFICAEKIKENILIPTTALSLSRSNNIAPHPLYDNLSYIGNIPGYEKRFDKYLSTLKEWAEFSGCAKAVKIFYTYISKGTLYNDIKDSKTYKNLKVIDSDKIYIKFAIDSYVYDNQEVQHAWIDYYSASLPTNGFCPITGKDSFIPAAYPGHIRFKGDFAKLFTVKPNKLDGMPTLTPGFIPAQKICNVLSYLCQHQAYNLNGAYIIFFDSTLYLKNPITSRTPAHSASDVYFIILQSPVKGRLSITHYQNIPFDYYNDCISLLKDIYQVDVSILDIITRVSGKDVSATNVMLLNFLKCFFTTKRIPKNIYMRLSTINTPKTDNHPFKFDNLWIAGALEKINEASTFGINSNGP